MSSLIKYSYLVIQFNLQILYIILKLAETISPSLTHYTNGISPLNKDLN
jgi:hypothetical protein